MEEADLPKSLGSPHAPLMYLKTEGLNQRVQDSMSKHVVYCITKYNLHRGLNLPVIFNMAP